MFDDKQNYYEILDIPPDATQSDIRQAYFRAKAAYGKDSSAVYSLFDASQTRSLLERVEEAYVILSNSEKRKEYDRTHGFLRQSDEPLAFNTKKQTAKNVFTFGANQGAKLDAAQEAARSVLGHEAALEPAAKATGSDSAAPSPNMGGIARSFRDDANDYSIPRTLASSSAAGPPSEDYRAPVSESRGANVRRIDLAKPYDVNHSMEEKILNEQEFHGPFLRQVREYKAITIEELSEFTKISRTYINCIEAEEFDSLPAPAYVRGFICQIAKALKLPHDKVAAGYMKHYNNARK